MKAVLIIGAGGHGQAVAEAMQAANEYEPVGFVDDGQKGSVVGLPVLGTTADLPECIAKARLAIVAIGKNSIREDLQRRAESIGFKLVTVIHPRASVSPSAKIGRGSAIMAGAVVGTAAELGSGVIVNCGAIVDHHCKVEDFGHLGTGAAMAGGSILGTRAWMQAGASLGYGVHVAADEILLPGEGRVIER